MADEVQNGVIEITTGDLLRCGLADFSFDFNPAVEVVRPDIPIPAKRRGQPTETYMHRWTGSAWSLVAQPPKQPKFHASSTMISGEKSLTAESGWEVLAGVVTTPIFFSTNLTLVIGRCIGQYQASNGSPQLRIVELGADGTEVVLTPTPLDVIADGTWKSFSIITAVPPRAGTNVYKLEGSKGGGISVKVRFASLSLLELVP